MRLTNLKSSKTLLQAIRTLQISKTTNNKFENLIEINNNEMK